MMDHDTEQDNADQAADSDAAAESQAEEAPVAERDPVAVLQEQVADLSARLLRERADFDNIRKRLRREADEAGTRAVLRFVRPLLTELDNFQLALGAADPARFQDFAVGVSMIKANLDGLLAQHQIEPIPCEGIFDPRWHEVVHEIEDAERQRGEIVQTLRNGWKLGDQVVRAAQVMVARPPVPPEPAPEFGAESEAGEG